MTMCQYSSKHDDGYQKVVGELQIILTKVKENLEADEFERGKSIGVLRGNSPSQATNASSTYCM